MSSDERSLTKIVDDGGPFVIWEEGKKGTFRRGMILNTWVCDNPECRSVHLQAVAIDERFKKSGCEKNHKARQKEMRIIGKEIAKLSTKNRSPAIKSGSKTKFRTTDVP